MIEVAVAVAGVGSFLTFALAVGRLPDDHAYFTSEWGEVAGKLVRRATGRKVK